jgi:hypothetical protein
VPATLVLALASGVSALIGTVLWFGLMRTLRLSGSGVMGDLERMRVVWSISAIIGTPILTQRVAEVLISWHADSWLVPYVFDALVLAIAAGVGIIVGVMLSLLAVAATRRAGLDSMIRASHVWIAGALSAVAGIPLFSGATMTVINAIVRRTP